MSDPNSGGQFDVSGLELQADALQERRDHGDDRPRSMPNVYDGGFVSAVLVDDDRRSPMRAGDERGDDRRADMALRDAFKNIADAAVGPEATQQARQAVTGTIREVVNAFKSTRDKEMSEDEAIDMAESMDLSDGRLI